MSRLSLWAGLTALALAAIVYAACSGTPAQEATPTPAPSPSRVLSFSAGEAGPAQVEAGTPISDPTVEPSKPKEAEVVYIGPRDVKAVALTFDTGVRAGHVPEILDILKEYGKPATFGVTGQWAVTNPDLLKRIIEEGHAVINHSWSHASFTGEDTDTEPLTADQMRDELRRTEEKIQEIAEVSTKPYFRPPYGDYDRSVNQLVWAEGYEHNVLWLIDSLGWEGRSTGSVVSVTLANAINGAIFLYHTDNSRDSAALTEIIEGLGERGMQMVTIPQLLGKEPLPTLTPTPTPTPKPTPTPPPPLSAPAPPPTPTPTPTPTPAPTNTPAPVFTRLAFDGFESGSRDGGSGWAAPWIPESVVVGEGQAHSGSRYLDMAASGNAVRWVGLGGQGNLRLRFWARFDSIEAGDGAFVRLSSDSISWTVYSLFTEDKDDNAWHFYDISIPFPASQQVFVAFHAVMDFQDVWHIDDVELVTLAP